MLALTLCALAARYDMKDVGITLDLPDRWESRQWSDLDFTGRSPDGNVVLKVWFTPWQTEVTEANANGWAAHYREKLEDDKAKNVRMEKVSMGQVQGQPAARVEMRFAQEGVKGVYYATAFATEGRIAHIAAFGVAERAAQVEATLNGVLEKIKVDRMPADLASLMKPLVSPLGVTLSPPTGWRAPLDAEAKDLETLAGTVGETDIGRCSALVHPLPSTQAELMLFCGRDWSIGVLDDASFADQEPVMRGLLFGKAATEVKPGVPLALSDRTGVWLAPEVAKNDLRVAMIPYDRGVLLGWAVGPNGSAEALDQALRATVEGISYQGPDNGLPAHGLGTTFLHLLSYKPWHPAILGSAFGGLVVLVGLARLIFRSSPPQTH